MQATERNDKEIRQAQSLFRIAERGTGTQSHRFISPDIQSKLKQ